MSEKLLIGCYFLHWCYIQQFPNVLYTFQLSCLECLSTCLLWAAPGTYLVKQPHWPQRKNNNLVCRNAEKLTSKVEPGSLIKCLGRILPIHILFIFFMLSIKCHPLHILCFCCNIPLWRKNAWSMNTDETYKSGRQWSFDDSLPQNSWSDTESSILHRSVKQACNGHTSCKR